MTQTPSNASPQSEQTGQIARRVVELMAEFTGRGPVKATTHINADCVTVVLTGVLTKGEQNLVESDQGPAVEVAREAYQDALEDALVDAIEHITKRRVRSLLSANDVEEDLASHVFVLQPPSSDDK